MSICDRCKLVDGFCTNPNCEMSLNKKVEFLQSELNRIKSAITSSKPKKPTICCKCKFYAEKIRPGNIYDNVRTCSNENTPVTDFIAGTKDLMLINFGDCKYFEVRNGKT